MHDPMVTKGHAFLLKLKSYFLGAAGAAVPSAGSTFSLALPLVDPVIESVGPSVFPLKTK